MSNFNALDPLLHTQLRLAIMSLLVHLEEGDFNYLKKETGATSGNLSVQIKKLEEAGYIDVNKTFVNNFPKTTCKITQKGLEAFDQYVKDLQQYIGQRKGQNNN